MDKYEYKLRVDQIRKLNNRKEYYQAMQLADSMDFRKEKDVKTLTMVSEVYAENGKYDDAIDLLLQAYELAPIGKRIIYRLTELALDAGHIKEAESYYKEFRQVAPNDQGTYILHYKIQRAKGLPLRNLIKTLEEYKELDFDERWAYELATLYDEAGRGEDCVRLCDEIILWFSLGKYVEKALALKVKYAPLTDSQREKLENKAKYEAQLEEVQKEYGTFVETKPAPKAEEAQEAAEENAGETEDQAEAQKDAEPVEKAGETETAAEEDTAEAEEDATEDTEADREEPVAERPRERVVLRRGSAFGSGFAQPEAQAEHKEETEAEEPADAEDQAEAQTDETEPAADLEETAGPVAETAEAETVKAGSPEEDELTEEDIERILAEADARERLAEESAQTAEPAGEMPAEPASDETSEQDIFEDVVEDRADLAEEAGDEISAEPAATEPAVTEPEAEEAEIQENQTEPTVTDQMEETEEAGEETEEAGDPEETEDPGYYDRTLKDGEIRLDGLATVTAEVLPGDEIPPIDTDEDYTVAETDNSFVMNSPVSSIMDPETILSQRVDRKTKVLMGEDAFGDLTDSLIWEAAEFKDGTEEEEGPTPIEELLMQLEEEEKEKQRIAEEEAKATAEMEAQLQAELAEKIRIQQEEMEEQQRRKEEERRQQEIADAKERFELVSPEEQLYDIVASTAMGNGRKMIAIADLIKDMTLVDALDQAIVNIKNQYHMDDDDQKLNQENPILRTVRLDDVEAYLKNNGHIPEPEMPKAEEPAEPGLAAEPEVAAEPETIAEFVEEPAEPAAVVAEPEVPAETEPEEGAAEALAEAVTEPEAVMIPVEAPAESAEEPAEDETAWEEETAEPAEAEETEETTEEAEEEEPDYGKTVELPKLDHYEEWTDEEVQAREAEEKPEAVHVDVEDLMKAIVSGTLLTGVGAAAAATAEGNAEAETELAGDTAEVAESAAEFAGDTAEVAEAAAELTEDAIATDTAEDLAESVTFATEPVEEAAELTETAAAIPEVTVEPAEAAFEETAGAETDLSEQETVRKSPQEILDELAFFNEEQKHESTGYTVELPKLDEETTNHQSMEDDLDAIAAELEGNASTSARYMASEEDQTETMAGLDEPEEAPVPDTTEMENSILAGLAASISQMSAETEPAEIEPADELDEIAAETATEAEPDAEEDYKIGVIDESELNGDDEQYYIDMTGVEDTEYVIPDAEELVKNAKEELAEQHQAELERQAAEAQAEEAEPEAAEAEQPAEAENVAEAAQAPTEEQTPTEEPTKTEEPVKAEAPKQEAKEAEPAEPEEEHKKLGLFHRKKKSEEPAEVETYTRQEEFEHVFVKSDKPEAGYRFALDYLKKLPQSQRPESVAKTNGLKLTSRGVAASVEKLKNRVVIIEQAGQLSEDTLEDLYRYMEDEDPKCMLMLIDSPLAIDKLKKRHEAFSAKVTKEITYVELSADELVLHAKKYAEEQDCVIDEMGTLALYALIEHVLQVKDGSLLSEVEDIMNEAIEEAEKISVGNLVQGIFGSKYNKEGQLILKEKHFNKIKVD